MPIPQRVQYSDDIEPLVQFIEDTPPTEIIDRDAGKAARRRADRDDADRIGAGGDPLHRSATRPSRRPAASARRPLCDLEPGQAP